MSEKRNHEHEAATSELADPSGSVLPCPSCGSTDIHDGTKGMNVAAKRVTCLCCGMAAPSTEVWNRRTPNSADMTNSPGDGMEKAGGNPTGPD